MQLGTVAGRRPQVSFWGLPTATLLPQLVSLKPAEGWEGLRQDLVGGTVTSLTHCLDMTRQLTTCSTEAPFRRMMASVKSGLSVKVDIGGGGTGKQPQLWPQATLWLPSIRGQRPFQPPALV